MVNSVEKAARILRHLSQVGATTVASVATQLELPRSTTYKILVTLEAEGLVERDAAGQTFHLGYRLIELGHRAQEEIDLFRLAHPFLVALNKQTDETVHLTVLDGIEVLYVDCVESTRRLRTYSVIGVRAPLYCTAVGKAILADGAAGLLDAVVRAGLQPVTKSTITERPSLEAELERTRRRGYSIDNRENDPDIRCVGAAIREADRPAAAAISVSGPAERVTTKRIPALAKLVVEAAAGISARGGALLERGSRG